ncbi:MAG: EAL domain-containing protein, partial [Lachnospiraceae bacterium]|nr:EAL domain-containing protein [Lachnospiraceae bacterium]
MENFMNFNGLKRKVLIVDDEEINREILGNILSGQYEVSYAGNGEEALEKLNDGNSRFSLVLLDLLMPVMDGFELIDKIEHDEVLKKIPIIVMTSEKPAEVKSIKLGASDFITKPYDMPEVILARCERIIKLYEDNSIIKAAEKDNLTGLFTKEFFLEYIHQVELYNLDRELDAICLNVDHFHMVNETYGRKVGDEVLKNTGLILKKHFSDGFGCRSNADNFYICAFHRDDYTSVFGELNEELSKLPGMPKVHFRIGIYQNVDKNIPVEVWFDHAKLACNRIRGDYTKQIFFYSKELNDSDLYKERLINDIDTAVENHDLKVYFQPKYSITGDEPKLKSAEALIRWNHPTLGMISPGDFVPLFESNGLIQKVDHFVWDESAKKIREWKDRYGFSVPVSVNVSRIDIYDTEFENRLDRLLAENNLKPEDFYLEITESAYSENANRLIEAVVHLRNRGFSIEMDDFGSGY